MDRFTETTHRSWSSRLGGALVGILIGLILVVVAGSLLWWNEGRAIDRSRTLDAGAATVVAIATTPVDAANAGALVHLSGTARTEARLRDPIFGIEVPALRLERQVEMYQWSERRESETIQELGGGETTRTTYSYQRTWSSQPIDSSGFRHSAGHHNPTMPYTSAQWQADRVTLGAFDLAPEFVSQIDGARALPVDAAEAPADFISDGSGFYKGTPTSPEVGDLRVRFRVVDPDGEISVVGRQQGEKLIPARLEHGTIALLEPGRVDAATMFAHAHGANTLLTWGLRLAGTVLLWIGLALILAPLKVVADLIPALGSLVGFATGLVAALLAGALGSLIIALAWIAHRPLLGGILLGAALLLATLGLGQWRKGARRPSRV
ncbi:TMEM43 family protein [Marichromatium bheemlicum]|uniref:Uncharacterized protein n=1 Tax=Marichromatium bheemlicum TaxID=365339 RepID=A0ABX1IAW0_9GAMM|nr:TMEM43 family protein [Marichromatium bheemlicum]NKN34678.1 hypothetical protein [Marichromatium bheemlicum]